MRYNRKRIWEMSMYMIDIRNSETYCSVEKLMKLKALTQDELVVINEAGTVMYEGDPFSPPGPIILRKVLEYGVFRWSGHLIFRKLKPVSRDEIELERDLVRLYGAEYKNKKSGIVWCLMIK